MLLLCLCFSATGCRIGYYLQAGYGQSKVIFGKTRISELLEDKSLKPERRRKLELVEQVRQFAFKRVGLTENDNYTYFYDLKGKPITYSVVACPRDSLDPYIWSFPIVGDLPYIGYFNLESAQQEARRLKERGYDVSVWPASAYSTLGWFSDPILSTMLKYNDVDLVDVILHEQTHATVYIKGDIAFNENLATFVGYAGSLEFFKGRRDIKNLQLAKDQKHDKILVGQFTSDLVARLKKLYGSDLSFDKKIADKKRIFARARLRFRKDYKTKLKTSRYHYLANMQYHNAIVSTMAIYNKEIELFEKLHKQCGYDIRKTVLALKDLSKTDNPKDSLKSKVKLIESAQQQAQEHE
jgi:predicted aminopeptidase